ncbi:MAG: hypothetical protein HY588_02325 [Candidatus Omnitrophica bacterium]|nr:hypothetical protein [Candidatus Omnitrophota bacterium]
MAKKRIGEILIENGSLTPDQLTKALEQQKTKPGKLLGKILIEMGFVSEEDIVVALATQFNVPYLPIGNFTISEAVDRLIPKEIIKKHVCVPLERVGDLLMVVMADPTNEQAIQEIEAATKCKVQTFVATPTEIWAVIQQHFHITKDSSSDDTEVLFRSQTTQKPQSKTAPKPS